jgi:hypothetical protein
VQQQQQQPARLAPASATQNGAVSASEGTPFPAAAPLANGNGNGKAPSSEFQKIQAAIAYIRSRCSLQPEVVMVLGSGLGPIADEVQEATVIPYAEIPHFHAPAVQGHPGKMVIGMFNGVPSLVLQVWVGRWGGGGHQASHLYAAFMHQLCYGGHGQLDSLVIASACTSC